MLRPTFFFALVIFIIIQGEVNAQGNIDGFFKPKGEINIALSRSTEKAEAYYAGPNSISFNREFLIHSFYGAYGAGKNFNIISNATLINGQWQDGAVLLKAGKQGVKVKNVPINIVGAIGFGAPLRDYEVNGGNAVGQQSYVVQHRGVVQATVLPGLFIDARGGFNNPIETVPPAYLYSFKIGYYKWKIYADAWFESQTAIGGKDYRGVGDLAPKTFRELGVSYNKIGGVIYFQALDFIGAFASYSKVLNGRNVAVSNVVSLGVVLKYNHQKQKSDG